MAVLVTGSAVALVCAVALVVIRLFKGWAARTTAGEFDHD